MTLIEAITEAHLLAQGKATAPTSGTNKYNALLDFANVCTRMWQNEPGVEWDSLRTNATTTATVSATGVYTISGNIHHVSSQPNDFISVTKLSGGIVYYQRVEPSRLQEYKRDGKRVVAVKGNTIEFSIPFSATDSEFGGTINIPCYADVAVLSAESDVVQVDDPLWLTLMMAAEFCRTKTSLIARVDDLVARASEVMKRMKENQESNTPTASLGNYALGRTW